MKQKWVLVLALLAACAKEPAPDQTADSIYFNGTIFTMTDSVPPPGAVVVKGGRIVDMGDYKAMRDAHAGDLTRMVDLDGGAMFPGYVDATQDPDIEAVLEVLMPEPSADSGDGVGRPVVAIGRTGDFVILDRNPLEADAAERREIRVMKVVRAGETVFRHHD